MQISVARAFSPGLFLLSLTCMFGIACAATQRPDDPLGARLWDENQRKIASGYYDSPDFAFARETAERVLKFERMIDKQLADPSASPAISKMSCDGVIAYRNHAARWSRELTSNEEEALSAAAGNPALNARRQQVIDQNRAEERRIIIQGEREQPIRHCALPPLQ
jgi:hypothetical protein